LQFVAERSIVEVDAEALQLIAIQADGGVRDAISMLDQCSVMSSGKITEEDVRGLLGLVGREAIYALMDALANHDGAGVLTLLDEQMNAGKDVRQVLLDLTAYGRSVMVHRAAPSLQNSTIGAYSIERLKLDGARFNHQAIVHLIEKTYKAANDARWSSDPRITAEMALLSLCSDTVVVADKPVAKPAAVKTTPEVIKSEAPIVAPQVTASAKTKPTAELDKFWGVAREQLEKSGKRAVKAFLEDSTLESLAGGQALVVFKSANFKERFEREDYRTILEKVLSDLSGETIRLVCRLEPDKSVSAPVPKAKAEPKDEIYPESVRKVHEMFGGQIIKQEDNKEEH